MTGVTTVAGGYDPEVKNYFDGALLDRERPFFVHNLFGQVRKIPFKDSDTIILRKQDNFDDTPAVLTEGVSPALEAASKFDIEIKLQQFGKATAISDRVQITVQSEVANEIADNLSQTMFGMLDKVTRNTLQSTATQLDADGGVNGNSPTEITVGDIDDALDLLHGKNAIKFTPGIEAVDGVGTAPVEPAYWGICHTDLRKDIRGLNNFLKPIEYPQRDSIKPELGATDEVRWVMSTEAQKSSDATPIYSLFIMGQNAYGIVDIDEVATEMILKPLGFGDDPLNQRQTMGFKAMFGAGIIEDKWMVNLRVTVSS